MPFTILRPSIAGLGGQACIDAEFDDRPWSTDAPCARVRSYRTSARESVLVVNRRMHMGIPEGAVNVKRVLTERAIFFPDEGREQPVESSRTSTAWARRKKPPLPLRGERYRWLERRQPGRWDRRGRPEHAGAG